MCRQIGAYVYGAKVNTSMALSNLDASDKLILSTVEANKIGLKSRGKFGFALVTEGGLYKLVMRAHPSNVRAKEFQNLVTGTVLPAIRKDGMYVQGEEKLDPNNDAWTGSTNPLLELWKVPLTAN